MKIFKLSFLALVVLCLAGSALAESARHHYDRGTAACQNGQYDQAVSHYNQALAQNPSYAEAYVNRGIAQARQGKPDQAIADFNQALKLNPNYARAYYNRALAFSLQKDYGQAWEDVHKAQALGYAVNPEFLAKLQRASGRSE